MYLCMPQLSLPFLPTTLRPTQPPPTNPWHRTCCKRARLCLLTLLSQPGLNIVCVQLQPRLQRRRRGAQSLCRLLTRGIHGSRLLLQPGLELSNRVLGLGKALLRASRKAA